jgi:hypothetical protein
VRIKKVMRRAEAMAVGMAVVSGDRERWEGLVSAVEGVIEAGARLVGIGVGPEVGVGMRLVEKVLGEGDVNAGSAFGVRAVGMATGDDNGVAGAGVDVSACTITDEVGCGLNWSLPWAVNLGMGSGGEGETEVSPEFGEADESM